LSREVAVEQDLVLDQMCAGWWSQCVIDALYLGQDDAFAAGPDDDRRYHHMEAVETPCGEKTRYSVCAAFNKHSAHAARREFVQDRRRSELTLDKWQSDYLHARRWRTGSALRGYQ